MARKVGQRKKQEVSVNETDPVKKLQRKLDIFRQEKEEAPGQTHIWFRQDEIRTILDSITILGHPTPIAEALSRLRRDAGTATGLCAWFEEKDAKVLFDLVS